MSKNKKIFVTQPDLPPLSEFIPYLEEIWESKWVTNNGKFHKLLEKEMAKYLGVDYISLYANGTLALINAIQVLRVTGEVITTPYSFVATTHALNWNRIKPIFVDVRPESGNLDPAKIESAITPQTTAILPVHVYGNPCKIQKIRKIADTYGLKVIYDAAHAFGVKINENSVLNFGDLSILSFHATKIYNTMEGGAIVSHDKKTKQRIDYLKNFGFAGETRVVQSGINAKMNEMQAALGLLQLKYVDQYIKKRKKISEIYRKGLRKVPGISFLNEIKNVKHNYSYFPIFVDEDKYGKSRDELYKALKEFNIYGRRYFFPLISNLSPYRGLKSANANNLPIANQIADTVICLPIYPDIEDEKVLSIIDLINKLR